MRELEHKEGWALKNWCFWTTVLEKTLESPLDCKEIQPVNPQGNQSWIFIGRTDAEAEAPILFPPDSKNLLIGIVHGVAKSQTRLSNWTELSFYGKIERENIFAKGWCRDLKISFLHKRLSSSAFRCPTFCIPSCDFKRTQRIDYFPSNRNKSIF